SFRGDLYKLMADTGSLLLTGVDSAGGGDPNITPFGIWLNTYRSQNEMVTKLLGLIKPEHENFHKAVKEIKDAMSEGGEAEAKLIYQTKVAPAAEKMFRAFTAILKEADKARQAYAKMNESAELVTTKTQPLMQVVDQLVRLNLEETDQAVKESDSASRRANLVSLAVSLVGVLVALALGILLSLLITRPLNRVIDGLTQGSDQVASAALQVKNASQALASGASQQAASLEETTAALEEMASMTRQNADNAGQADSEVRLARELVERANQAMSELSRAMDEIHRAGGETAKIIKTIDEIAFQTNLLALNAAVEAARAGEAGAGFAVVAEEVRNLAQRAAEAARNTAMLIETTIAKTKLGTELVERSNQAFGEVASNAAKVGSLVAEIAAASSEQAQGIEQVNRAALEMDKVTQLNAANAEQSAAASEELTGQAVHMQDFVAELATLVGGARQRHNGGAVAALPELAPASPASVPPLVAETAREQKRKAQELIPFHDDEGDF
ncbi:MAG: methyl-accepting chemotaxis protein, partial [Desulfarculus sp.]|nr:methyl-accepting chemotaxis protein [Desulfarculus sp.]